MSLEAPEPDELFFVPLGGSSEIGMNLNLYGHDGHWLMVDLGITFPGAKLPGVEILMPDPTFIVEHREALAGLVLTHAHEDHIGAVAHIWPRLRCPIYATAFTAAMLRPKFAEAGLEEAAEITEIPLAGRFRLGPFDIELITLTHSIPEPNALVLRTAAGTVCHTGDWKLDEAPVVGESYDKAALQSLGEERILALVCDSTNALVPGESGSEADLEASLDALFGEFDKRILVTCFASNVARLETVGKVARAHGRYIGLLGRSLFNVVRAAKETGYLSEFGPVLSEEEIGYLPRREVALLTTGSQGEWRAALWRIARDEHPEIELEAGDAVIFSSRVIPGNEVAIHELQNRLAEKGIEVVTSDDHLVHVSGHPARDELARMYQWVRPEIAVPVHGEPRHLVAHAQLAAECQVPQQIVPTNGAVVRLAPGPAKIVAEVTAGRLALDGTVLRPLASPVIRDRQRMSYNGAAHATLVVDARGALAEPPCLTLSGLVEEDGDEAALEQIEAAAVTALASLTRRERGDDEVLAEAARQAIRRTCRRLFERRPVTSVHVVRLER